jgi:hypothetical protein
MNDIQVEDIIPVFLFLRLTFPSCLLYHKHAIGNDMIIKEKLKMLN